MAFLHNFEQYQNITYMNMTFKGTITSQTRENWNIIFYVSTNSIQPQVKILNDIQCKHYLRVQHELRACIA